MLDTMTRYLSAVRESKWSWALRKILLPLCDGCSTQALISAGLVIHGAASALAKTGAADFYASVQGILVKIAASTDMPALTGIVITAAFFNVACFYVDSAGVVTVAGGTQGATLGAVVFPQPPTGKALVGFLIITSAGTFTGGTTALDTATTVFISPTGPFDPTVLI
jgi:hypothetical protein